MALQDSQNNPAFVHRPETGKEFSYYLVGVPILRGGRVTGVSAVQNRTRRHDTEEEIETLETIAMVIVELIASEYLIGIDEHKEGVRHAFLPATLDRVRLSGSILVGKSIQHEQHLQSLTDYSDLTMRKILQTFTMDNSVMI